MKNLVFVVLAMLLSGPIATVVAATGGTEPLQQVKKATPIEVYYFHMTRRCATCQAVEKVTEQAVSELYPEEMKRGDITFKSVNIEDKGNKDLIKKLKVQGQSLLIVNGKNQVNITDKGFMYAVNEPEKLKAEVKVNIEKFAK